MTTTLASSGHLLATMPGGTGNPVHRIGGAQSRCVVAWQLSEGDVMVGGETVLAVQREPVRDRSRSSLTIKIPGSFRRRVFGREERTCCYDMMSPAL